MIPPNAGPEIARRSPDAPCLNCGDATSGRFCRNCGQRKTDLRISLRQMLMEVLDDQFSLNSALPRTARALVLRPGELTREYMAGRIVRYIPPFRLYLVCSVIFFLVLSLLPEMDRGRSAVRMRATLADTSHAAPAAPPAPRVDSSRATPATPVPADSNWADGINIRSKNAMLDSLAKHRLHELGRMKPEDAFRRVFGEFLRHAPQMMFLLLPFFAFFLKLLYLRRRRLYVEHFVFALHLHSFTYLLFTAIALVPAWLGPLLSLWHLVYIFLAMRRVYGQGIARTGIKYLALGFCYSVLLFLASIITLVLTIAFM